MTNYETAVRLGTVTSSLVSKDKGDFSNRMQCAGEQIKNSAKTLLADTVVIGGVAAGVQAARHSSTFAEIMSQPVNWIAKGLRKMYTVKYSTKNVNVAQNATIQKTVRKVLPNAFTKVGTFLKNMKTSNKAIAVIGVIGSAILARIAQKHFYQAGQIDQKYTDKANLKKRATEIV